jgi:hypothetical protein
MAIGFMTMIGLISAGLASLTMSSLKNRTTLEVIRGRQYAADGAVELAISHVRALPCSTVSDHVVDTLNGTEIRVDWVSTCAGSVKSSDGTDVAQRNVVFSACQNAVPTAPCVESNVIIRAQVNFALDTSGAVVKTFVQSWSVNR